MQFWTVGSVRRSMCLSPHLIPYSVLHRATDQEIPLGGVHVNDSPKYQPVLGTHTHTQTQACRLGKAGLPPACARPPCHRPAWSSFTACSIQTHTALLRDSFCAGSDRAAMYVWCSKYWIVCTCGGGISKWVHCGKEHECSTEALLFACLLHVCYLYSEQG